MIQFWTDRKNIRSYYRCVMISDYLNSIGITSIVGDVLDPRADFIFAYGLEGSGEAATVAYFASSVGLPFVYIYDDADDMNKWQKSMAKYASAVIAPHSNFPVHKLNKNTYNIPDYLPPNFIAPQRERNEQVVIGWAGGHKDDFALASAGMKRIIKDYNPIIRPIGMIIPDLDPKAQSPKRTPRSVTEHYNNIASLDVAIVPLAQHKKNWRQGQALALEYAAFGVPVVASENGIWKDWLTMNGYFAYRYRDWVRYTARLVVNKNDHAEKAESGRKKAWHQTLDKNERDYDQILSQFTRYGTVEDVMKKIQQAQQQIWGQK